MAFMFLLIIGLVISKSTGKYDETERVTPSSSSFETINLNLDKNSKSAKVATVNIPRAHISNQHHGLGKLSEAIDLSHKSDLKREFNDEDIFNIEYSPHHHHHQQQQQLPSHYFFNSHTNDHGPFTRSGFLKRIMLRNTSVTCNDGTQAGYYFRPSFNFSKKWIVFLEGGWYCFSIYSCHQRWLKMRNLMTSAHWPEVRIGM